MNIDNGIHPGLPRREYDQIDALNISLLIEGRRTMAHLKYAKDNKEDSTDAMRLGSALHCNVLEPAEFEARYVHFEGRRYGKEWDAFKARFGEKTILTADQMSNCIHMGDSLRRFEPMKKMLSSKGTGELTVVWDDPDTGTRCKGMIDRVCEWNGYTALLDLKTCVSASRQDFAKSIGSLSYHVRAAWYLDALNTIRPMDRRFFFVLVEKSAPFLCNWFDAHDEGDAMIEEGRKVYRRLLRKYAECVKSNVWPGYPVSDSPEQISLNKWDYEA